MTKVRVDMGDLTLGELADVSDLLGMSLSDALQGPGQMKAMLTIAYVIVRRTDPTYTLDQARQLKMSDLEVVNVDPEALAGGNGIGPVLSPASGLSTPSP